MTPTVIERKHKGTLTYFISNDIRYCVTTCCEQAQIDIVDESRKQCRTICTVHYPVLRTYEMPLTDDERDALDSMINGTGGGFNPVSDPHGARQQRRRHSGYTTSRWYQARGL